jgi:CBS domain-containing protein
MSTLLRVSDFYSTEPVTLHCDTEIMRAVQVLLDNDISGAPVIDNDGKLVGILTERDLIGIALSASYFDEPGGKVSDFMSIGVQTVAPGDSLMDVAQRFADSPFRRFPVVENGRLLGIIGRRDLLRAMYSGRFPGKQIFRGR